MTYHCLAEEVELVQVVLGHVCRDLIPEDDEGLSAQLLCLAHSDLDHFSVSAE